MSRRTSRTWWTWLGIGLLVVITSSCSGPTEPEPVDFHYPLAVGNKWNYEYTLTKVFDNDRPTETSDLHEAQALIIDSGEYSPGVYYYDLEAIIVDSEYPHETTQTTRLLNLDHGLYTLWTRTGFNGGIFIEPKVAVPGGMWVGGEWFQSVGDLYARLTDGFIGTLNPSGQADEFPLQNLQYPLETNATWVYRPYALDSTVMIQKRVIGVETITVPAGRFTCTRVNWEYSGDYDGVSISDYFTPQGLIMRRITAEGLEETTYEYPDGTGEFYTLISEYALVSFTPGTE